MQGFITIHRQIMESAVYKDSNAVHLWLHLLLKCNHKDNDFIMNGNLISVKRGQTVTGRKALSVETGIQESKIERLLKLFEKLRMIEQHTNNRNRLITVLSYDKFQTGEQQVNNTRTTDEQLVNTNNNDNKEDNDNNLFDKPNAKPKAQAIPYQLIIDCYHECLPNYSRVMKLTDKRKTLIAKFWKDDERHRDIKFYENYFSDIPNKPWLNGDVQPGEGRQQFRADLDWLLNINNFTKVLEGKYNA